MHVCNLSRPAPLGLQLQRKLNYTKCLVALLPDVASNAQNGALKKTEVGFKSYIQPCEPKKISLS